MTAIREIPAITAKDEQRFWAKVTVTDEIRCWPWTGRKIKGYGQFKMQGHDWRAHRISCFLAYGIDADPLKNLALHSCHNPSCVSPVHLRWGTAQENSDDMTAARRQAIGDRNGKYTKPECTPRGDRNGARTHPERLARGDRNSKRTPKGHARAAAIRDRHADGGITQHQIAQEFGMSQTSVSRILGKKQYAHVL